MAKKLVKDYTPEQLWKLERRVMMQDIQRNPESSRCFEKVLEDLTGAAKAHNEAERFKQASEEMGRAAFKKWCDENPLSQRAAMHLSIIERQLAAPAVEHGKKFTERKKGALAEHTREIHALAKDNPDMSAKELQKLVKHPKGRSMSALSFANVVSNARKEPL